MTFLFGGNGAAKQQQQAQQVANDRQLAALNSSDNQALLTRKNPRGRRLFADASKSTLPDNLA